MTSSIFNRFLQMRCQNLSKGLFCPTIHNLLIYSFYKLVQIFLGDTLYQTHFQNRFFKLLCSEDFSNLDMPASRISCTWICHTMICWYRNTFSYTDLSNQDSLASLRIFMPAFVKVGFIGIIMHFYTYVSQIRICWHHCRFSYLDLSN